MTTKTWGVSIRYACCYTYIPQPFAYVRIIPLLQGTIKDLTKHAKEYTAYHNQLLKMANKEMKQSVEQQMTVLDNKTESLRADLSKIKAELSTKLQPLTDAMVKAESAILQLQDGLSEVSLLLQTLQAASYDETFIWKIPEVTRPRQEARQDLYTAPVQENNPEASAMMVMSRNTHHVRPRQEDRQELYTAPVQEENPGASTMMVMSRPCEGTLITRLRQEAGTFSCPVALSMAPVQEQDPDASMTMAISGQW